MPNFKTRLKDCSQPWAQTIPFNRSQKNIDYYSLSFFSYRLYRRDFYQVAEEVVMELILIFLLLAFVALLFISVAILAFHIQQLRKSVQWFERPPGYSNPVNLTELRKRDSGTAPAPRPISTLAGTCPWLAASRESVVLVPSRPSSPKQVLRKNEGSFVVNMTTSETFEMPSDNKND